MTYRAGERGLVAARAHQGHYRTPDYLKDKSGIVERVHGTFANPETRAYGGDGLPERPLYLIGFAQRDVWPDYGGHAGDRIHADLYEHWLEEPE